MRHFFELLDRKRADGTSCPISSSNTSASHNQNDIWHRTFQICHYGRNQLLTSSFDVILKVQYHIDLCSDNLHLTVESAQACRSGRVVWPTSGSSTVVAVVHP